LQLLLQQSPPVVHAAPLAPQQRPVVAPGESQWPEQHSLSAVQCRDGNTVLVMQHLPFAHVCPEQQRVLWSHAPPGCEHSHWPLVQRPLQHWDGLVHVLTAVPQQVPPRQVAPYAQPPVVVLHVPPSAMRHRDNVSQTMPSQHSCVDVLQVPPLVLTQQRPPLHVRPSQQKSPVLQALLRSVQQVAVEKSQLPPAQQPDSLPLVEQAPWFGTQAPQICALQTSGSQHVAVLQLVPSPPQHFPPTHDREQQSAASVQIAPLLSQMDLRQWPSVQSGAALQHSSFVVQVPPCATQPQAPPRQAPLQQSDVAAQASPKLPQAHTPPVQLPRQQSAVAAHVTLGPRQV
jgi:hypothetical protein